MQKDPELKKLEQQKQENKQIQENSLISHDINKEFVQKNMIVFSVEKLKNLLSQEEIQHLNVTLNSNKDKGERGHLEYVPLQALPSVTQYLGKQYRSLHPSIKSNYAIQKHTIKSLKYLNNIMFPNLLILNLSTQAIQSLQELTFLNAPLLRCLQLYDNKIWNMDALVKADFPSLEKISFYLNPVMRMQEFYRFHSKKLRSYQFDSAKQNHFPLEDYRFLFKMQDPVPLKISVLNRQRINLKNKPYFNAFSQSGTLIYFYDKRKYRNGVRILRS